MYTSYIRKTNPQNLKSAINYHSANKQIQLMCTITHPNTFQAVKDGEGGDIKVQSSRSKAPDWK